MTLLPPIIITGCARSGTSMTAGVISLCGAFGGDMFGPNRYNKRGMFENRTVREGLVKPYLRSIDADPRGQKPLPDMAKVWANVKDPEFVKKWRDSIQCIFTSQGVTPTRPWFYKGAKACLFWPLWHCAFPEAQWIIVRRTDADIIKSCQRTAFMNAYQTAEGWQRWIDKHKACFQDMHKAGLRIHEVWPEKVIGGEAEIYYNMLDWLGLLPAERLIEDFVQPMLWGTKK